MSRGTVVVIGLARSGAAVVRALHADGYDVLVVDSEDTPALRERAAALPAGVRVQLGGYAEDVATNAVMICPSPGVPWRAPVLEVARAAGVPVRSEIDLVFERCRGHIIGITGTNGKTTTTALVGAILAAGGRRVHVGGNIGVPMLDRLDDVKRDDWVVLELSSFQLETVAAPRCDVGCVLNVTPDHLDRHGSMEAYAGIKARVVEHARETAVLGWDDPETRAMAQRVPVRVRWFAERIDGDGACVQDGDVVAHEDGEILRVLPVADIPLFGAHNVHNVLAAVAVTRAAGVATDAIAGGVRGFHAVPHRLQPVLDDHGVLWVNDSKATNAESAVMALRSFGGRSIVWIGGGTGAGTSPEPLIDAVVAQARLAVLNGASAAELDGALAARGFDARVVVSSLADAVAAAADAARPGDVVLLAPGYKSFDQFHDFEERGERFTALVRERVRTVVS